MRTSGNLVGATVFSLMRASQETHRIDVDGDSFGALEGAFEADFGEDFLKRVGAGAEEEDLVAVVAGNSRDGAGHGAFHDDGGEAGGVVEDVDLSRESGGEVFGVFV